MIQTSNDYKSMMAKPIRNRGYISVALGVVNQNAQGDVSYFGGENSYDGTYYSKGDVFRELQNMVTYGSLEQNFAKANGKFTFVPRPSSTYSVLNTGYISNGFADSFKWTFTKEHDIKGLTIEFEPTAYPTEFTITTSGTDGGTYHFTNSNSTFETDTTFGEVSEFLIEIDTMSGGAQFLHIRHILCGVGINFQDDTVESMNLESFVSGISVEVSYKDLNLSVLDVNNTFDVDQTESFINYLEPLQNIKVSVGVDLDNGKKEWLQIANCRLKEWNSKKGKFSFVATDLLTQSDVNYSNMVIQSRTAKSEFQAIFTSMGLTPDDYEIDDNLASVYITNPMEENNYRDCLQILANATRSIVYEDERGIICVEQAFDTYIPPSKVYELNENSIFDIYKTKEAKVKTVKVKIYTYEVEDGEIRLVDDDVWHTEVLGTEGVEKVVENSLISSQAQAELIARWIGDYYSKQKTYDIDWRGDPALQASDYIEMSNQFSDSIVAKIEQNSLSFNGAFRGRLNARQAE